MIVYQESASEQLADYAQLAPPVKYWPAVGYGGSAEEVAVPRAP
jgi:hypothetical protein